MPPKVMRGRKKANGTVKGVETQIEVSETNSDTRGPNSDVEANEPSKVKSNKKANAVVTLKQQNGNSDVHLIDKSSVKESSEKFCDSKAEPHSLANNKLLTKEIENNEDVEEVSNTEVVSQMTELPNKESNLDNMFVVPSKGVRKKANVPAENVEHSTKTKSLVSNVKKDLGDNKKGARRGRKKADVAESSEIDMQSENISEVVADSGMRSENISEVVADNGKTESNFKIDVLSKSNSPPSKRERKKAMPVGNEETMEVTTATVKSESNEPVPSKRGRKKADNFKADSANLKRPVGKISDKLSGDINDHDNAALIVAETEVASDKTESLGKPHSKRGRKKANIPLKETDDAYTERSVEDIDELVNETKVGDTDETEKPPLKIYEIEEDLKQAEDDNDKSNEEPKKRGRVAKAEKKAIVQPKEPSNINRKRTKESNSSTEENKKLKSEHDVLIKETKTLKVALKRNKNIDKMMEVQSGVNEVVQKVVELAKNAKPRGKRAKDDGSVESKDNESIPAKISKTEPKSKGQSKKDKMPDVTLLDFSNESTSPSGKAWNLKLSSWNVNGIRAWLEKDGLAYIKHENPDIMCFQETKCSDKQLPEEVNIEGYHSYWLAGDKDGYSGVGLLTKEKPISVKYGIGAEEHDSEGRVITAEYKHFFLVTAYIPNAGRGLVRLDYRMQWDKDFKAFLSNLDEKKPVVLCGDLNVAHEEIDLANPKSNKKNAGFTKEEREGFSTLLKEGPFIDSFRFLYPEEKAYTFWTYMMNARAKNVGWRLDYFVLSQRFTEHLCDNVIRKDVFGSDHCPITLFLAV